jgi:hypothetical protein
MRIHWTLVALLPCLVVLAVTSSEGEPKAPRDANAYPYGEATCLQGNSGTGLRLFLTQNRRCEGKVSCPYLEVDITEEPVPVHKSISIGTDNRAFRCRNAKESCEQAASGDVIFDHFEDISGKSLQTDGYYELKFSTGMSESGLFKVTCFAPCG